MIDTIHKKVKPCIQCGICSASCPLNLYMDVPVRKIVALIKAGETDEIFRFQTFWLCASCYFCRARCPKNIDLADIMYSLHQISLEKKIYPKNRFVLPVYQAFMNVVEMFGRNFEPLMLLLFLRRFPKRAFSFIPLGIYFLRRKNIHFRPSTVKDSSSIRRLLKKAENSRL